MKHSDGSTKTNSLEIVIVTWNSSDEIVECLNSLNGRPDTWRVTVVDNNSSDGTVDLVKTKFPSVRMISNRENVGFARANNQVIKETDSDFVLLLNPDTVASISAIEQAIETLSETPSAGALGVTVLETDGSMQPSCQRFPSVFLSFIVAFGLHMLLPRRLRADLVLSDYWPHDEKRKVDTVSGAFMLVTREAIEAAGGLPEQYFLYYEEIDWSYQMLQRGIETWFTPEVSIVHHGNRSGVQKSLEWRTSLLYESKYKFCKSNYGRAGARMIQILDYLGFTFRKWFYAVRPQRELYETMRLNQSIVKRAFSSS